MNDYKIIIDDFKNHLINKKTEKSKRLIKQLDSIKTHDEFKKLQLELHNESWYSAFS